MSESSDAEEITLKSTDERTCLPVIYSDGGDDELQETTDTTIGHRVIPKKDCPHVPLLLSECIDPNFKFNQEAACSVCQSQTENWICLTCFDVGCSKYVLRHMEQHHKETGHGLALSVQDLSVWCYECQAYVDGPALYDYRNVAHVCKFGEKLPWCYG